MKKLWKQNQTLNTVIEQFITGDDIQIDQQLIPYDIFGSLAHAQALHQLNILTKTELLALQNELHFLYQIWEKGELTLTLGDEDAHTKIELLLTAKLGDIGKKLHTGRSRNDQVLTTLRLYEKQQLFGLSEALSELITELLIASKKYKSVPMAGFTHTQPAMPSSVGLWFAGYADGLIDVLKHIQSTLSLIDQSPLGSAAGYGVSLNLNRNLTASLLGFSKVQLTAPYAQHSRLTFETLLLETLLHGLTHLNTFASDILFFASKPLCYINVNADLCTGSSIMPHKKNVDVAELLRGQYHIVVGKLMEVLSTKGNLISGYHRDFQISKKAVMESFTITQQAIKVATLLVKGISPNIANTQASLTNDLFSVDAVLQAVHQGVPFRDAYHNWQHHLSEYLTKDDTPSLETASFGSAHNLPLKQLQAKYSLISKSLQKKHTSFTNKINYLLSLKGKTI